MTTPTAPTAVEGTPPLSELLRELVVVAVIVGGVGFAAIGASGLLAAGMGVTLGQSFVAGSPPGVTYTAERCAVYQRVYPGDCEAAATAHHFDEVVSYRIFAGVLGLLALGAYAAARRLDPDLVAVRHLPPSLAPAVGAAAFGGAAVLLGLPSVAQIVFGVPGAGNLLSGGVVSLALFGWNARGLVREASAA